MPAKLRWYQGLTKYHWWVLAIAVSAWMFDCMDQRLFVLSRSPAVKELLGEEEFLASIRTEMEAEVKAEVGQEVLAGKWTPAAARREYEERVVLVSATTSAGFWPRWSLF